MRRLLYSINYIQRPDRNRGNQEQNRRETDEFRKKTITLEE